MDNVILKSLSAENFASFAERIEFSTETDSGKKEHLENITFAAKDRKAQDCGKNWIQVGADVAISA